MIDDYGHHPIEISAVLAAARKACDHRIVAVVQPHRYTRLHDLFEEFCGCFHDADTIIVADVYAAGEQPIPVSIVTLSCPDCANTVIGMWSPLKTPIDWLRSSQNTLSLVTMRSVWVPETSRRGQRIAAAIGRVLMRRSRLRQGTG